MRPSCGLKDCCVNVLTDWYIFVVTTPAASTGYVPDEVWADLDTRAGRLPPRSVRRCWLAAAALVVVAVAVTAWTQLGQLGPRLTTGDSSGASARIHSRIIDATFDLTNPSRTGADISSVSAGSGFAIEAVRGIPHHLAGHSSTTVTMRLRVTDCTQRSDSVPIHIGVKQLLWHIHRTVTLNVGQSLVRTACRPPAAGSS
jgi:hypothetical protein